MKKIVMLLVLLVFFMTGCSSRVPHIEDYGWVMTSVQSGEDGQASIVHARRLTPGQLAVLVTVCAAGIVLGAFVLDKLGDPQPWKDSVTTVLSIIAQFLMALAFMDQWALWIITNIVSVIMWSVCVANGDPHSELMVIMWIFYLANSINGLRVWLKLSRS